MCCCQIFSPSVYGAPWTVVAAGATSFFLIRSCEDYGKKSRGHATSNCTAGHAGHRRKLARTIVDVRSRRGRRRARGARQLHQTGDTPKTDKVELGAGGGVSVFRVGRSRGIGCRQRGKRPVVPTDHPALFAEVGRIAQPAPPSGFRESRVAQAKFRGANASRSAEQILKYVPSCVSRSRGSPIRAHRQTI